MLNAHIDTAHLKASWNLLDVIGGDVHLRKAASTRGGEFSGPCPFCGGRDRLRVQPDRGMWWCRQCSESDRWQDVIAYVRRRDGLSFEEALRRLGAATPDSKPRRADPEKTAPIIEVEKDPGDEWRGWTLPIVAACEGTLWSAAGDRAREWLLERGIRDETLRHWRIGFNPADQFDHNRRIAKGITIPWFVGDRLWQVKIRRPVTDGRDKYVSIAGGVPVLFGGNELAGHRVGVLCEGEFDCMLLGQEAGDLVGVATLGSASKTPGAHARRLLLQAPRYLVAYDADREGQAGAAKLAKLSASMRPISVPCGKDITAFWTSGGHLRDWIAFELARLEPARLARPVGSSAARGTDESASTEDPTLAEGEVAI